MLVGGHSQYSVASQRSWSPVRRLPLPPSLNFDTWWNEAGQRVGVVVSYNTATGVCTASLNVNVDARIMPRHGQTSVEPWDLHVGAKLRLLGRTLTLRKVRCVQAPAYVQATCLFAPRPGRGPAHCTT